MSRRKPANKHRRANQQKEARLRPVRSLLWIGTVLLLLAIGCFAGIIEFQRRDPANIGLFRSLEIAGFICFVSCELCFAFAGLFWYLNRKAQQQSGE